MTADLNTYNPDYAVPPGWILEEHLNAYSMSQAEFARRCGRSAKLISDIIAGQAPVEPGTALQFEKVLGVAATIWLGIEVDYQLYKAREEESVQLKKDRMWSKKFAVKELVKRHYIQKPIDDVDAARKLLSFFGVATTAAWDKRCVLENVVFRHSPTFSSSKEAVATWLRMGELDAEAQECADYDAIQFKQVLKQIRVLTSVNKKGLVSLSEIQQLCNGAGVAFVLVKGLPKVALSGTARWLSPKKALIQLSSRHLTDDHLWFSFFHEAAHLLLHSKMKTYLESGKKGTSTLEAEADAWASHFLVPTSQWRAFTTTRPSSQQEICAFADQLQIAPGIVVGMLQHEGIVPWSHFNGLKQRYQWTEMINELKFKTR